MIITFDIGGVLGKYPEVFRPIVAALQAAPGVEVHVITDIAEQSRALEILARHGYAFGPERVHCASYADHGEMCKSVVLRQLGSALHVDDHPGYCVEGAEVSLFVWPNPRRPYEADQEGA